MHPVISYELATARIADLRRAGRQRRFGIQLWTLLHAQVLLGCPAAAAGSFSLIEDDYRRFAAGRKSDPGPRPGRPPAHGQNGDRDEPPGARTCLITAR